MHSVRQSRLTASPSVQCGTDGRCTKASAPPPNSWRPWTNAPKRWSVPAVLPCLSCPQPTLTLLLLVPAPHLQISEIAGGEDDEDDDDQRPFCGSKGPACCDALVDLVCRSLPMHLVRRVHAFTALMGSFSLCVCVCVGLPVQVVEMQLDNAETPTVSEADALACSASALSVPTFSNCTTAVSDTCSVNVVRLRPTATPQPSPAPLPPNVVGAVRPAIVFNEPVSGMRMPLGPFCACRFVLLLLLLLLLLAVALCVRTFVLTTCV